MPSFHIVVFGIGAMGCLFAGRLTRIVNGNFQFYDSKILISMVGHWPEQRQALASHGLTITEPDGTSWQQSLNVYTTEQINTKADFVLVFVKSWQTNDAAEKIVSILHNDGLVLTLQNGLGNKEQLAQTVNPDNIVQGVTSQGATVTEPGYIKYAGGGITYIQEHLNKKKHITKLTKLLHQAGIKVRCVQKIDRYVWEKLIANAAINPLTGLLEITNGKLLEKKLYRSLMIAAAQEVIEIAKTKGISLSFDDPVEHLTTVCKQTAVNRSSMLQDIESHRPTEIEAINGAVVHEGKLHAVVTPVNQSLLELIRKKCRGYQVGIKDLHRLSRSQFSS